MCNDVTSYTSVSYLETLERWCVCRGGGQTNQNKCCGKSGWGDQYIGDLLDFKVGGISPIPLLQRPINKMVL